MCSGGSHTPSRVRGFPIRISTDRSLVGSSPWLFAATHVLHRHQAPRHPPLALCSLENKDARARYGVLKERVTRVGGPSREPPSQSDVAEGFRPQKTEQRKSGFLRRAHETGSPKTSTGEMLGKPNNQ